MAPQGVAGDLYESITGQLFELGRQLRQPNGYSFDPAMLKMHLQDAIEGRFVVGIRSADPYIVSVDYSMSAEELERLGHYGQSIGFSDSNYWFTGWNKRAEIVKIVVEIVDFRHPSDVSTDEVLCEFDRAGYRPANLQELLAFGAQYPDVQRRFPVVALGSTYAMDPPYDDDGPPTPYLSHAPYLCMAWGSERLLGVVRISDGCHMSWRFAAVRK